MKRLFASFLLLVVLWGIFEIVLTIDFNQLQQSLSATFSDRATFFNKSRVAGLYFENNSNNNELNSVGFRDREHTKQKPAGTKRIAIIGDSLVYGTNVKKEETFGWVLQDSLKV
jgi:hypothetical protein